MARKALVFMMVGLFVAVALSACGRKGAPDSPPGTTYPREYPSR